MRISTRTFTGLHSPSVLLAGLLLGTAVLAYGFDLRHAVDADHIAAIDNVTRKLMHEGQRPVTAGLYFSLGHSTIVGVLTVLTVLGTGMMRHHLGHLKIIGGVIGTSVPTLFLLAIAAVNVTMLADTWRYLHEVSSGAQTAGVLDTPVRKLHYNLSITTLSVGVAVIVGGIETLGLIGRYLQPAGALGELAHTLTRHSAALGSGIAAMFLFGWLVSFALYRLRRYQTA
ncbi:MAG: HoxN/HupN/NixA family nickel/cobalt transporter [Steroidobacteraceae bacterium]